MREEGRVARRPRYQDEPTELAPLIWDQGSITPLQVMRIAAWKSARGLASLTLNSEEELRARTELLVRTLLPWRHIDVLEHASDASTIWAEWTEAVRTAVGSKRAGTGMLGSCGQSAVFALS